MPNAAPVLSLDVTRAAFVKKDTVLDFKHGLLKKVTIKKPSEAVEFAKIPINIGKEILSIPAELIQLKVNINNQKDKEVLGLKTLLDNQVKLIEAQESLIKKQNEINSKGEEGEKSVTPPAASSNEPEEPGAN